MPTVVSAKLTKGNKIIRPSGFSLPRSEMDVQIVFPGHQNPLTLEIEEMNQKEIDNFVDTSTLDMFDSLIEDSLV